MKKLYLLPLLFLQVLTSCKDGEDDPTPQLEPQIPSVSFNFRLDPQPEGTEEYELVVSQKDGEVLLDTVIAARTEHTLKVKSADTKFDVTTIYSNPADSKHAIRTYVQVNPDNWHIDERISRTVWSETVPATITYANIPYDGDTRFAAKQNTGTTFSWPYSTGSLRVSYSRLLPTDLTYLLVPSLGKYIFAEVTSPETHVDFSNAITAEARKYTWPTGVTNRASVLLGYTKAGDYSKTMILYLQNRRPEDTYDVLFPTTVIEEFESILNYTDADGYRHNYVKSGTTVPTEMPFIPKSDFTVTKSEANDFQIQFAENKPTTYTMLWESGELNASWRIFASPEETGFKPEDFLENLSAVFLEGKNLGGFALKNLISQKAEGYSHQSINDYNNTPEAYLRKELREYRGITKTF
ncbi:hypothetical protein [Pontibacter pamirensis]|uniref:hypothetical protein n=1 Tax=Pontibacter pamirensis TaxID=2562824 RepID=UPI001389AF3F|nr:hypothetical protein [Pontibacter pamirensis]